MSTDEKIRLGRMGFLNVLPIYHPIESGEIPGEFEITSGPPRVLNKLMAEGLLDVSANSSIEYARHADRYLLVPDLAIGSCGPVMSVLLLSRVPIKELDGRKILVSAQTHTSAALMQVLFKQRYKLSPKLETGDASAALAAGAEPDAILAIGDEALRLRSNADYPHRLDLGEAWRSWTGHPFIFGVWLASREALKDNEPAVRRACEALLKSKQLGSGRIPKMARLAAQSGLLTEEEMNTYFNGLVYDLGPSELEGLKVFFQKLVECDLLHSVPALDFLDLS